MWKRFLSKLSTQREKVLKCWFPLEDAFKAEFQDNLAPSDVDRLFPNGVDGLVDDHPKKRRTRRSRARTHSWTWWS